jgi:hypothetical protein
VIGTILDELVPLFAAAFSDPELLDAHRLAAASRPWSAERFAAHSVERYLLGERELGRVAPQADCRAAASLVLSLCHDRAFHDYLRGMGRPRRIARELDLIAEAITLPRSIPRGH